ncbi:GAF domain-containing protein [Nocardioides aurantiacus]|uniref:GAF domain-containing protein n=1 Tax=Nocardioides aurantiacus TaxID=86796 RepID=UPI00403F5130
MLHASLLEAERRGAVLAEVIEALSVAQDATILAQRAAEIVCRASRTEGAFVYLWDAERSLLVMRAATEGRQQRFVNKLTLRLGEGITGWSALMRRSAIINDDLLEDPRFVHIPAAMEAEFRSALVVPILIPGGEPVGVFTICSTRASAFNNQMAETVGEVASLLASGIDRAAQFEVRTRQSKALHALVGMAESPPRTVHAALSVIAERCLTIIPASLCIVELTEAESHGEDVVGVAISRSDADRLPEQVRETGTTDRGTIHALLRNWEPRLDALSAPIRVAGHLIGTATCHRHSRFAADDRLLLEAVTNYAALVISGATASGASPLEELLRGRDGQRAEALLAELGWAPKSLATPFVVRIDPDLALSRPQALANATRVVEKAIHGRARRLVPSRPGTAAGLALGAIVDEDRQQAVALELSDALAASGHQAQLAVGWGGPSAAATGLVEGLNAAREAALWATLVQPRGHTVAHKENAVLRNLAAVAYDLRFDLARTTHEIAHIARADTETGSALLETLCAYIEHNGSAADAAKTLYIHRNTMRQRLDKLEKALTLPLNSPHGWLTARLALLIRTQETGAAILPRSLGAALRQSHD